MWVFVRADRAEMPETKMAARLPIVNFSSKRNLTKLDRQQDLFNVLLQVCVFRTDRKTKMVAQSVIGWDIFDFSSDRNLTKLDWKKSQCLLPSFRGFFFRADRKTKMAAATSDWLKHFRLHL